MTLPPLPQLSLSTGAVALCLVRLALAPTVGFAEVAALAVALLAHQHSRALAARPPPSDPRVAALEAQVAAAVAAHAVTATAVDGLKGALAIKHAFGARA